MGLIDDALTSGDAREQRAEQNRTWNRLYNWRFHLGKISPTAPAWAEDPAGKYGSNWWTRMQLRDIADFPDDVCQVLQDFVTRPAASARATDGWVVRTPQGSRLFMSIDGADDESRPSRGEGFREACRRRAVLSEVKRHLASDGVRAKQWWLELDFGHPYLRADGASFKFELVDSGGDGLLGALWNDGQTGTQLAHALATAAADQLR